MPAVLKPLDDFLLLARPAACVTTIPRLARLLPRAPDRTFFFCATPLVYDNSYQLIAPAVFWTDEDLPFGTKLTCTCRSVLLPRHRIYPSLLRHSQNLIFHRCDIWTCHFDDLEPTASSIRPRLSHIRFEAREYITEQGPSGSVSARPISHCHRFR